VEDQGAEVGAESGAGGAYRSGGPRVD